MPKFPVDASKQRVVKSLESLGFNIVIPVPINDIFGSPEEWERLLIDP
ncbi:MAG: hypothetical protein HS132_02535 [Planctomycetia bacterium]|nr:hypothetical protein [Planctomycetia bacterium]